MRFQHSIQPPQLILIPFDRVWNLFARVPDEVVGLSLHRSDAGVHEEEPVVRLEVLFGAWWVADEVFLAVVCLNEVLHDAAGFEERDG